MKNRLFTMFVVCTTFFGFTSVQLEAVSALPNMFVVALTKAASDTIALSTNTLGMILDPTISTTGTQEQFCGSVEYNCSENNAGNQLIKLTQVEPAISGPGAPSSGWYAQLLGYQVATTDPNQWQALEVYSNVLATSKPNDPTYQAGTALINTSGSANITAVADATYTNFIGLLSIYALDDNGNSTSAGTYQAVFVLTFAST